MKKVMISIVTVLFALVSTSKINAQTTSSLFKDSRDGKTYKTIKIGTQTWMAENLNYKTSNSWCYNNNSTNCEKYGRLYTWDAAKNACPSGWNLPTKSEFEILLNNYGGESDSDANYTALIPNGTSGFSASFGGWRNGNGDYELIGEYGNFWSSSIGGDMHAWNLYMNSYYEIAAMDNNNKDMGLSVRCVQDN